VTFGMTILSTQRLLFASVGVCMFADGAYFDLHQHSSLATSLSELVLQVFGLLAVLLRLTNTGSQQLDSGVGNLGSAVSDTALTLSLQVVGLGSRPLALQSHQSLLEGSDSSTTGSDSHLLGGTLGLCSQSLTFLLLTLDLTLGDLEFDLQLSSLLSVVHLHVSGGLGSFSFALADTSLEFTDTFLLVQSSLTVVLDLGLDESGDNSFLGLALLD
jgi:hypothetical protein